MMEPEKLPPAEQQRVKRFTREVSQVFRRIKKEMAAYESEQEQEEEKESPDDQQSSVNEE